MFEDVGNGSYNAEIEIDGNSMHFHFSVFNNAYGQVCDIYADTKKCRVDYNLQIIESNMSPAWVKLALERLVHILEKPPLKE